MKLKIALFIAIISGLLSLSSCKSDKKDEPQLPTHRTVLVYMVANNSLGQSSYDYSDLQEMQQAATDYGFDGGRLIVYHAPASGTPALKEITQSGIVELKRYDSDTYSVESSRMKQVIADTKAVAPALDYGLILWSHANAWLENTGTDDEYKYLSTDNTILSPLAFGDDRNRYMKVTTLAETLENEQFSFIYFDCCLMASIEVCYELRHTTPYIIASGTEIPARGMPYHINVPYFFAEPPQLKEATNATFDYYNAYSGSGRTCTMSLIATKHMEHLADVSRQIFTSTDSIIDTNDMQSYDFSMNSLYDFKQYIHALNPDSDLLKEWDETLELTVLYKASTPKVFNRLEMTTYCGLGCYIVNTPDDSLYRGYANQAWWKDVVSYKFNKQ